MYGKMFRNGFSLIELILVIAIIAILAAGSAPFYARFIAQNSLDLASNKVVSTIRKSQAYAMDGKDDAIWGFCMVGEELRLFSGACLSPTFSEDMDLTRVTVSGINETVFSGSAGKRGEPSDSLNITLTNESGSVTILLNQGGGLEIN